MINRTINCRKGMKNMKFIDQKRLHQPADTEFVKRKFLDIRYAPEGDWYLPNFFTPDGQWKTEEDFDQSGPVYPGMKFEEETGEQKEQPKGKTKAMLLREEIRQISEAKSEKAVPSKTGLKDQSLSPFPADGEHRLLDIYLPNEGEGPFPVVIDVFGGGYYYGRKSSHKLVPALEMLRRGFAVVSFNYSMSFMAAFPIQIQETKAVIRFVRKHAAEYDLDPDRIALMGESAGAHMAALAAVTSSCGEMKDSRWPNSDVSDEVQAVIAVYCPVDNSAAPGMFDIEKQIWGVDSILRSEMGSISSMDCVLAGGYLEERKWMNDMINPENYVNRKCPPFFFLHGTQDMVVPMIGSMHFAGLLSGAIGSEHVKYQIVEGAHHDIHDFEKDWIYDLEEKFLKDQMHIG